MKFLTDSEKIALIRDHGERIAKINLGWASQRGDVIASALRIIELTKSVSKDYWAPER